MNITELTVHELQQKIKSKELTITEITKAYIEKINEKDVVSVLVTIGDSFEYTTTKKYVIAK